MVRLVAMPTSRCWQLLIFSSLCLVGFRTQQISPRRMSSIERLQPIGFCKAARCETWC